MSEPSPAPDTLPEASAPAERTVRSRKTVAILAALLALASLVAVGSLVHIFTGEDPWDLQVKLNRAEREIGRLRRPLAATGPDKAARLDRAMERLRRAHADERREIEARVRRA